MRVRGGLLPGAVREKHAERRLFVEPRGVAPPRIEAQGVALKYKIGQLRPIFFAYFIGGYY